MQLYGRGPRRRLAPMLGGDARRVELAHSVLMSLPGSPMLRYGDEIGMGDDLDLPDRLSVRTPMQWSRRPNGGFSTAPADRLARPVISDGEYGYPRVNVLDQQSRHGTLLGRIGRMGRTRQSLPEVGNGPWRAIDVGADSVLALLHGDGSAGRQILMVNNLAAGDVSVRLPAGLLAEGAVDLLEDSDYEPVDARRKHLDLRGYGYRWLRPS
jgi:maltose alpha-D-glucosyltransferase/alpha-amylase